MHLAKVLRSGGNLLMLDEPTNDLDVEALRALEEGLLDFPGCAIVISHDRWFLDRIATHILAFEGDSKVTWFQGNYEDYEKDRHGRLGGRYAAPDSLQGYRRLSFRDCQSCYATLCERSNDRLKLQPKPVIRELDNPPGFRSKGSDIVLRN